MKVLHVVRGLLNSSGTTHIVVPLAEEQARQGASVCVYFVEKDGEAPVRPDPRLVVSRSFAQSLPGSNPGISFTFARAASAEIHRFDVVHIHAVWNFPTYWAMRAAAVRAVPYIVAPQGSFEPWALGRSAMKKRIYGPLTELPLLDRAGALQAVTEVEARQFRSFGLTAPVVVIPNGVDAKMLAPRTRPPQRRTLLFLSRLHPKKGVDILLHAFAQASAQLPDLTLIIAGGDGGSGYRGRLETLARSLRLGKRCRFIGEVRGAAKREALAAADAFVLPSHSEGLPVAAIEAMASGLPLILTPGCNLPDVAAAGAGLIVDLEPGAVAAAIARVLSDPRAAQDMGANGRRLAEARFTWERIAAATLDLYRSLTVPAVAPSLGSSP
jgi:poly(glycerol-phosphate) alpha-glucosyltransferase